MKIPRYYFICFFRLHFDEPIGNIYNGEIIKLKSWKNDFLHRDAGISITTWHTGIGNEWNVEMD